MSTHYYYGPGSSHGKYLQRAITASSDADRYLEELMDVMVQMMDGDGTRDEDYLTIKTRFGFASEQEARAAYAELQSMYFKTSHNGPVDNVRAARDQAFARFMV